MTAAEAIDLGRLSAEPGFLLRLAQLQVYEDLLAGLQPDGLRPGAFSVLYLVARNPGARQGALAERLTIKRAQMTKLVQALVARNLVTRHVPQDDRRGVQLRLTDAGAALLKAHKTRFLAGDAQPLPNLSAAETRTLKTLLAKLTRLETARPLPMREKETAS
ncbi:MAG: MarR family transcriptional regulator [Pseudomonadota bacterium]